MSELTHQKPASPVQETASSARSTVRWDAIAIWSVVAAVLLILGWGLLQTFNSPPTDVAPNFEMIFYDGYEWEDKTQASLDDMKGQIVVLNFWASWCVECRLEADLLEQAWLDYRDQGVVFVGVAYVDTELHAGQYLQEFNITYPNAPDLRTAVSRQYKITGVPETFFIDRDGRIVRHIIGPVQPAVLTSLLDSMLAN
jgi:cytochrome c biogenesis protein CcmG, thiol:disulfide interchange protein DsbE